MDLYCHPREQDGSLKRQDYTEFDDAMTPGQLRKIAEEMAAAFAGKTEVVRV